MGKARGSDTWNITLFSILDCDYGRRFEYGNVFIFFYLVSNGTHERVFTMWIILTYTVSNTSITYPLSTVGIPTVFLMPIVDGTLFNCPSRYAQRSKQKRNYSYSRLISLC